MRCGTLLVASRKALTLQVQCSCLDHYSGWDGLTAHGPNLPQIFVKLIAVPQCAAPQCRGRSYNLMGASVAVCNQGHALQVHLFPHLFSDQPACSARETSACAVAS